MTRLLLIACGASLVVVALAADAVGIGGRPGFGWRQLLLAGAGAALVLAGVGPARAARALGRAWRRSPRLAAGPCLLLCAWSGLLLGLVEVAHLACLRYGFGRVLRQPPELVWMAPLSFAALFVAAAAPLLVWSALRRTGIVLGAVVFPAVWFGVWSQCLAHAWLHGAAALVLGAGAACQATRLAHARAAALWRACRATAPWLGTALVVTAAALALGAAAPGAPRQQRPAPAGAPNLLLIVLDTVRADHLGFHGYHRDTTPHLDRLAARSVLFENAYTTSPWTLPSHASMFTGRYHHEVHADWQVPLDDAHRTLAETLSEQGYATAGFVGNLLYCSREWGLDRGFEHYEDFYVEPAVIAFSTNAGRWLVSELTGRGELVRNDARTVTDRFLRWLPSRGDRPFFAFLNYFDAHEYYLPPPPHDTAFGPRSPHLLDLDRRDAGTEQDMAGFVRAYDGCIRFVDEQIGRLLAHLGERGLLDDTRIVVTADHGEQFGEHGLTSHSNSLYRPLLHAPLVVFLGDGRGIRLDDEVTLRDLPATIVELAGLGPALPGVSLSRCWARAGAPGRAGSPLLAEVSAGIRRAPHEPVSRGDMKCLVENGLHYILNGDGAEELYDLRADPRETRDLAGSPAHAAALARLRARLAALLAAGS